MIKINNKIKKFYIIFSKLLNLYLTKCYENFPAISLTTAFIEVKADINIRAPGFLIEAMCAAGPDPIDLPNTIISEFLIFFTLTK